MPNTLAPFGFRHLGNTDGASPTFGMITKKIKSDNTTDIFYGDPVKLLNTGYIGQWTASTAVSQLAGIFAGCQYNASGTGELVRSKFWPGTGNTGDVTAFIIPCNLSVPGKFVVQNSGTVITLADIGANADVSVGTGSQTTGISGATLDQATLGTTATLPFRIVDLWNGVGNGSDATTDYNWVIVAANVSGAGSTGI